jgi:hypothetical protein
VQFLGGWALSLGSRRCTVGARQDIEISKHFRSRQPWTSTALARRLRRCHPCERLLKASGIRCFAEQLNALGTRFVRTPPTNGVIKHPLLQCIIQRNGDTETLQTKAVGIKFGPNKVCSCNLRGGNSYVTPPSLFRCENLLMVTPFTFPRPRAIRSHAETDVSNCSVTAATRPPAPRTQATSGEVGQGVWRQSAAGTPHQKHEICSGSRRVGDDGDLSRYLGPQSTPGSGAQCVNCRS